MPYLKQPRGAVRQIPMGSIWDSFHQSAYDTLRSAMISKKLKDQQNGIYTDGGGPDDHPVEPLKDYVAVGDYVDSTLISRTGYSGMGGCGGSAPGKKCDCGCSGHGPMGDISLSDPKVLAVGAVAVWWLFFRKK